MLCMSMDPGARQYILAMHSNSAWVLECLLGLLLTLLVEVSEDLQPSRMRGDSLENERDAARKDSKQKVRE